MAVLDRIRDKAAILVIVIGLALLAFLFGDIFQGCSSLSRDREMNAFTVNGTTVKIQDYEAKVNQLQEMYRAQNDQALSDAEMQQLRNQVYTSMVAEQILAEECQKIGIVVSPAETWELTQGEFISPVIMNDQAFRNPETGMFDKVGLLNFLKQISADSKLPEEQMAQVQQARSFWLNIEKNVRQYQLNDKYSALVSKSIVANKLEREAAVATDANVADILYVQQRVTDVPDLKVEVSEADLQAYYDSHKEFFRTEDRANVDVVYASIRPSEEDFAAAKEDIEAARKELLEGQEPSVVLNEYSDAPYADVFVPFSDFSEAYFPADFLAFMQNSEVGAVSEVFSDENHFSVAKIMGVKTAPQNLKVRHIVLLPKGTMEGQADADSLLAVLKADPTQFAQAAIAHSMDRNSSTNGGEIGWLTEAMATQYIDANFSNAIFGAQIGTPFMYTSKYGQHIILVDEAGESVKKYKVAYANKQVTPSTETQTAIYTAMKDFLTSQPKGASLDSAAVNAGYQVLADQKISGSQPMLAQNIDNSRQMVFWAMTHKPNSISDITECGDKYVIVQVKDQIKAGYLPMNWVSSDIRSIVENEKKVAAMQEKLQAANYADLASFATAINAEIDTLSFVKYSTTRLSDLGYIPEMNAVAAYAPVGVPQVVKSDSGVILANVLQRVPDANAPTEGDVALQINANRRGFIHSQALQEVIRKSKIEDRRFKFQ